MKKLYLRNLKIRKNLSLIGILLFILSGTSLLAESSPKVVGIFGGSACPWSKELRSQVWESSSFQTLLTAAEIKKEEKAASQNELETPLLILFSSQGEEIGRLGFLVIPAEKYVSLFKEMLSIHELCQNPAKLNVDQLLQFYRKCQVLNMKACEEKILQAGIAQDTGTDFLLEQYAKVCKKHHKEAQRLKAEIRARKPDCAAVEWQLALLSFQGKIEKMRDVNDIVKPLKKYLRRYGDQDKNNRWRCHLILAEFYKDKNIIDKARFHAEQAMADAPDELKQMIAPLGIQ
jgi:hypothetical protein